MLHLTLECAILQNNSFNIVIIGISAVTEWCADAVAFAVNEPPHFCQVAVPPGNVIDCGRLHEESVIGLHHPLNPIFHRFHQRCAWPAAHEGPHLLKGRNLGFLGRKGERGVKKNRKSLRTGGINSSKTTYILINGVEVISKHLSINLASGFVILNAVLRGGHINAMSNPR